MDSAAASDRRLAETADQDVANDTSATTDQSPKADAEPKQADARRAVQSMAGKRSPIKKQAIYIFTGFATAGFILAAYYLWQNDLMVAPQTPSKGTLVTAPETSAVESIANNISEAVIEPAKNIVQPDTDNRSNSDKRTSLPGDSAPPAAVTTASAPVVTDESPKYKIEIHKRRAPRAVPAQLEQAYQAYQGKDYQQSEQLYREALRRYPGNRDAMLGLAAIAQLNGNRRVAHYYYTEVLKSNPGNQTALLALQALKGEQHQLEHGSQIKHWLQSDRDNAPLHFALGNQHAANGRWKEAQQSYFEAYRLQTESADFAFNLAISLDQLGLKEEALDYYLVAKKLSGNGASQFSSSRLDRRINQLRSQMEPAS